MGGSPSGERQPKSPAALTTSATLGAELLSSHSRQAVQPGTATAIEDGLAAAGVAFIDAGENSWNGGAGVRLTGSPLHRSARAADRARRVLMHGDVAGVAQRPHVAPHGPVRVSVR